MAGFAIEDAFLKTVTQQVPVGQVLMMFGAGGLCVFALMARRVGAPLFHPQVFTKRMLYRAVFEFFGRLFYILAIALTPMSSATAILQAAPLFVALGARVFLHEKIDGKTWLAIWVGLLGVLIILRPSADDFSVLSLLAAIKMPPKMNDATTASRVVSHEALKISATSLRPSMRFAACPFDAGICWLMLLPRCC